MVPTSSLRSILLAGVVLMLIGSAAVSTPATRFSSRQINAVVVRPQGQAISPREVRRLESWVSRLPATEIVEAGKSAPAAPATDPSPPPPQDEAQPRPVEPRLEYVPTSPALEQQVANALVSQDDIKRVIGNNGAVLSVPGILRQVEQSGEEIQLKVFGLAGKRLAYDPSSQMYSGTIWLGVNEIVGGRPSRPLVTPVEFEVLDADFANPSHVRVVRTGAPYAQVQLRLAAVVDGGKVTVVSNLVPEPISLSLPIKPSLIVEAGHSAIEGLGLGSSEVNVSLIGLANPQARVVTLRTSAGYLTSTKLRPDETGIASATIRSDGLGPALITASSPGLVASSAKVDFGLPYITFLASIFGGLAGGAIRVGTRPPRRLSSAVRLLGVAVLLGLLVFSLYAVGVNVLPVSPSVTVGAALVFAVSGLGAFLGPSILRHAG